MSQVEERNKRGCGSPVITFFIFAILCVVAFLIVILVKSCNEDRAEDKEENAAIEELTMNVPNYEIEMIS